MRFGLIFSIFCPLTTLAAPKLYFSWAQPYDKMCARGFDYSNIDADPDNEKLKVTWSLELKTRIPEFQNEWDKSSPSLFKVFLDEFKKDFSRREYTASLSTCAPAPSMPDPLVLNVSRYLKAYTAPKEPKKMKQFVDLPFHELLHLWLSEHFKGETPLKLKYSNEKLGVVSHIHLFAIQSLVYEKTGNQEIWKNIQAFHMKHGGVHQRALEILEQEGRANVLKELKY